jgi:hypothetical protein
MVAVNTFSKNGIEQRRLREVDAATRGEQGDAWFSYMGP